MRIKLLVAIVSLTLCAGCGKNDSAEEAMSNTVVGIDEASEEPRFTFIAPDGFVWDEQNKLFHNEQLRTSILMAHAPQQTLNFLINDFSADQMLSANMELVEKDVRQLDGRETLLVKGNRLNAPFPQQFCIVAYGTDEGCAQLTAIYPEDLSDEIKANLESALLNSTYGVPE
ncbi:hypothetical protein NG895_21960 [Aeoliella sp. ICT_H6.2]|uniref:Uncharacterized protein n=1 Tax=Aeoliella straminimaris TaxID=2954799 RepID=A0A9X2JIH5_9BACT|nr:hypothetical protein [Aeoliella straminimaris]MCO6046572.1 hypothetical protein [Aeoliella straminimaris]